MMGATTKLGCTRTPKLVPLPPNGRATPVPPTIPAYSWPGRCLADRQRGLPIFLKKKRGRNTGYARGTLNVATVRGFAVDRDGH